jgi:hypothetical protein
LLSQSNLSNKNISVKDTTTLIPDSVDLGSVLRVIYKNKPGVFLTNEQELITLAKFQWKEIYKLQAKDFKAEVYKLELDIKDANRQIDRYKVEVNEAQFNQLAMRRSVEGCKSLLDQRNKEFSNMEISRNYFRKESRIYKIATYILMGVSIYVVVSK